MYDVVPTREITPRVKAMGMRVGGTILLDKIDRDFLLAEARSWGISPKRANSVIDSAAEKLHDAIAEVDKKYPAAASKHSANSLRALRRLV